MANQSNQSRCTLDTKFFITAGITTTALAILLASFSSRADVHYDTYGAYFLHTSNGLIPLLMILGDSIVHKALAVVTGFKRDSYAVPLSFGWLSYAVSTLPIVFSGKREMIPKPELDCTVVNLKSGQSRKNDSWILSRLLRDEMFATGRNVDGLCVTVCDAGDAGAAGDEPADHASFSTYISQLIMAAATWAINGNSTIFMLTAFGLGLSSLMVQLPVWRAEKFSDGRHGNSQHNMYALTRGHGHRHVLVTKNVASSALNLEDMATDPTMEYDWFGSGEGYAICGITLGWFLFTVFASSLQHNAVTLFSIMAIGTFFTTRTAALPWWNEATGIPYRWRRTFSSGYEASQVLQELEVEYPGYSETLLKECFPGALQEAEKKWCGGEVKKGRATQETMKEKVQKEFEVAEEEVQNASTCKKGATLKEEGADDSSTIEILER